VLQLSITKINYNAGENTMKLWSKLKIVIFSAVICSSFAYNAQAALEISGPITNPTNGHIYYLLESDFWEQSETASVALGGHLVTINDQAENDWVFDTFANFGGQNRTLWLGYHRTTSGGPFSWICGENPGFENWYPGEPNNARGDEDYAAFVPLGQDPYAKQWFDSYAATTYFFDNSPIHGVVEVVPLPTTFILFGSALTGLGLISRHGKQHRTV
jgi:hypothetical protein